MQSILVSAFPAIPHSSAVALMLLNNIQYCVKPFLTPKSNNC